MFPLRYRRYLLTRKKPAVVPAPETTMDLARQLLAEHGRDGVLPYMKRERERLERKYQLYLAKLHNLRGDGQGPSAQQFTAKFPNELPSEPRAQARGKAPAQSRLRENFQTNSPSLDEARSASRQPRNPERVRRAKPQLPAIYSEISKRTPLRRLDDPLRSPVSPPALPPGTSPPTRPRSPPAGTIERWRESGEYRGRSAPSPACPPISRLAPTAAANGPPDLPPLPATGGVPGAPAATSDR